MKQFIASLLTLPFVLCGFVFGIARHAAAVGYDFAGDVLNWVWKDGWKL